jgi:hypothetical protein
MSISFQFILYGIIVETFRNICEKTALSPENRRNALLWQISGTVCKTNSITDFEILIKENLSFFSVYSLRNHSRNVQEHL